MRPLILAVLASGCVAGVDGGPGLDGAPREHPTEADAMAVRSPELVDDQGAFTAPQACDGLLEARATGLPGTEDGEAARVRFAEGAEAFASGDYVVALEAFCDAHRLHPASALVYNVAVTYERLGLSEEAAAFYEASAEWTGMGSPMAEEARRRASALRAGEHAP